MHMDMTRPWFTQWNWDLLTIAFILLLVGGYLVGTHLLALETLQGQAKQGETTNAKNGQWLFYSGIAVFAIAILSPVAAFAHMLFVGHMIQHLLLAFVVSPLLVLGLSTGVMQELLRWRPLATVWKWLSMPLIAGLLFNGNLWLWHAPPLLEAMMNNPGVHLLVQVLYILTGILFWWPLIGEPAPQMFPLNMGGKMIYLLLADMPMVLLGAGLTLMPPFYAFYRPMEAVMGMAPTLDQQMGGLTMWVPGSIFIIVIASILFLRWMLQMESRQKLEDERLAREFADEDELDLRQAIEH